MQPSNNPNTKSIGVNTNDLNANSPPSYYSHSSSSSILGVNTTPPSGAPTAATAGETNIGDEVKQLISKIITQIKISDDETPTTAETSQLETAKFDADYLNEIIDKVLSVLKQSSKHASYFRLYQTQLNAYMRQALQKYENRKLVDCMEDILVDISDILYNELSSYTTTLARKQSSSVATEEEQDDETSMTNSATSLNDDTQFRKVYLFDESQESNVKYKGIDLLKKLSLLLNEKLKMDKEEVKQREPVLSSSSSSSSSCSQSEHDEEENKQDTENENSKQSEPTCKVVDINDLLKEPSEDGDEIKIDDLPTEKLNLDGLENIIMNSISDALVGDANELPIINPPSETTNQQPASAEDAEITTKSDDDHENEKSEASTSDNFVIIGSGSGSGTGSSSETEVIVDVQKEPNSELEPTETEAKVVESPTSEQIEPVCLNETSQTVDQTTHGQSEA